MQSNKKSDQLDDTLYESNNKAKIEVKKKKKPANIYHTVRTVPKSNRKISETQPKYIPLTYIYLIAYFPGLVQARSMGQKVPSH
jgi:hypothetical protein